MVFRARLLLARTRGWRAAWLATAIVVLGACKLLASDLNGIEMGGTDRLGLGVIIAAVGILMKIVSDIVIKILAARRGDSGAELNSSQAIELGTLAAALKGELAALRGSFEKAHEETMVHLRHLDSLDPVHQEISDNKRLLVSVRDKVRDIWARVDDLWRHEIR